MEAMEGHTLCLNLRYGTLMNQPAESSPGPAHVSEKSISKALKLTNTHDLPENKFTVFGTAGSLWS